MAAKDISIGEKYGRWIVESLPFNQSGRKHVMCRCECDVLKSVRVAKLFDGTSKSCGCLARDLLVTHGLTSKARRRFSREYWIWNMIVQRCTNPKVKNWTDYGGRGIQVCDQWLSFENFHADMGERPSSGHSIERRNNDGNYTPENCFWATRMDQGKNKRNNHYLTIRGESLHLAEWARRYNIQHTTILARLRYGWSVEDAITVPVRGHR